MNPEENRKDKRDIFNIRTAREKMSYLGRKIIMPIKVKLNENNGIKKIVVVSMVVVIASMTLGVYKIREIQTRGYIVYYGGKQVGIVREKEEVSNLLENLKESLSDIYNCDVVLNEELKFEETHAKDQFITTVDEIENNIKSQLDFSISGYALVVNGQEVGYSKSKEELEQLLNSLKEPYTEQKEENNKILEVSFLEDVNIVEKEFPLNKLSQMDELKNRILSGGEEVQTHIVEVGESLWTIAKMYGVSADDLIEANSDKDPQRLQIGDEIKLTISKPMLTVVTVEEVEYTAEVDYDVKVEYDSSMYKTQSKVKVKGQKGQNRYLTKVTKHNGKIVDKQVLKEEVVKKPVNELVVKGTKELPKAVATGAFTLPTRGSLSSRYGMRGGRMHKGVDIAASVGTPIYAADGGKVVFAGWKGSYGYLVEINHGNGYVTRYAHCSSINVKVGDRVVKGQLIARVGATGNATGPHLHFEVLRNGVHVNPAGYIY